MSANIEATQNLFRIWNTREFEALIPYVTEDIVWMPATMHAVEGGSFEGVDGLRRFFDHDEAIAAAEARREAKPGGAAQ